MCCSTSPASFEPHAIHNQGLVTFGKPEPDHRRSLVVTQFGELKNIGQDVLDILLLLFPEGKLTSVMDRTSWKYGQTHLNVLVLAVWVGDLALQLAWKVLPHGGNSDMRTRMFLVGTLLRHLPAGRWAVLIADRDVIGQEWFSFLRDRGIKRCIRIRENTLIDEEKAKVEFQNLQVGQVRGLLERAWVYGSWMQVVATLSPQGERVLVASDRPIWETLTTYRRRWTVDGGMYLLSDENQGTESGTNAHDCSRSARTPVWFAVFGLGLAVENWGRKSTGRADSCHAEEKSPDHESGEVWRSGTGTCDSLGRSWSAPQKLDGEWLETKARSQP